MQFAKYDVSLSSSSLAYWLEGMWGRIILFLFLCVWRVLHKDIMINIQGTAFVTNCCIIKEGDVQRYAKKNTFIRYGSSSSEFVHISLMCVCVCT